MIGDNERLDVRLRSLLGTLDAQPGFEARVAARLAAHAAHAQSRADLRAGLEHRRELERRRLARETWSRGLTIAGLGMAASALVWRHAADVSQWVQSGGLSATLDPAHLSALTTTMVLVVLWPWLRQLPLLREF